MAHNVSPNLSWFATYPFFIRNIKLITAKNIHDFFGSQSKELISFWYLHEVFLDVFVASIHQTRTHKLVTKTSHAENIIRVQPGRYRVNTLHSWLSDGETTSLFQGYCNSSQCIEATSKSTQYVISQKGWSLMRGLSTVINHLEISVWNERWPVKWGSAVFISQ